MSTKINLLHQSTAPNSVLFLKDMEGMGISRYLVQDYVESGWLKRMGTGVYRLSDSHPDIYSIVAGIQRNKKQKVTISASTALELQGFTHYVSMGKEQVYVQTERDKRLPSWVKAYVPEADIHEFSCSVLSAGGQEKVDHNGQTLAVSSPEKAIMECLYLAPSHYALMDVMYLMEMLTALRPKEVEEQLRGSQSVKVNRLFLYMAEKAGHQWLKRVNSDGVKMGSGTRSFSRGGIKIAKYDIIVPRELAEYE